MHTPERIALARIDRRQSIPTYSDPEWQANTFAGELLAPPHITKGLSEFDIARYCGVSGAAAKIQFNQK